MATVPLLQSTSAAIVLAPEAEEKSLARAFALFSEAAASLERSYAQLQTEVARLRHELETTNRDLVASLEENHRMREHLKRILDGLPCGVLVTEADGSVSLCNPETQRLLGTSAHTQLAAPIRDLLGRAGGNASELEWTSGGGEAAWITIRRAQLSAGEGGSSIFILEDISALKRLRQEHETLRRRQALAEMSAVLAHEIRNPLGSLELFAGLLAEAGLGPEEQGWVRHLQAGLRALAATVNNVLQFHSQPQPRFAPTDLGPLLRWLEQFLRPLAERAALRIELAAACDGVVVAADRHRLEQVFLNLALNSFHFMPAGGTLWISARVGTLAGGRKVWVEIADTGPGIAAEHIDHIFEAGFTTRNGSPGLGLTVCKTIMEQHGGSIRVANRSGSGATFTLELPVGGVHP